MRRFFSKNLVFNLGNNIEKEIKNLDSKVNYAKEPIINSDQKAKIEYNLSQFSHPKVRITKNIPKHVPYHTSAFYKSDYEIFSDLVYKYSKPK